MRERQGSRVLLELLQLSHLTWLFCASRFALQWFLTGDTMAFSSENSAAYWRPFAMGIVINSVRSKVAFQTQSIGLSLQESLFCLRLSLNLPISSRACLALLQALQTVLLLVIVILIRLFHQSCAISNTWV